MLLSSALIRLPRHTSLAGSVFWALMLMGSGAQAASLADIYQQAKTHDPAFQIAEAEHSRGQLAPTLGRSALLPQINGSASYTQADLEGEAQSLTAADGNPAAFEQKNNTRTLDVGLNQTLFDLGAWHRFQASKTARSQSDVVFTQASQQLILRSAEAYFASLRALDELASAQAEEKALEQGLMQTRQRFDVGLTAITEVNEAQAEYDSAKANRLIREGDLVIAFEALEVLTGETHTQVAPLKDNFPVKPAEPASRDSWVEMAKAQNPDLQIAKLQQAAAQSAYQAARAGHLPTLSAGIGYSDNKTRGEPEANHRDSQGTQAHITLRVPIYSGGRISAERQQAAFQQVAAQEAVTLTERQITQSTRSQYQRVDTGVSTVQARKQAIISSESALAAVKAGYEVGTRNWVNVLDAQKRVYAAKRNYSAALYDYVLASLALKQSAGTLTEADITLLDHWLNKSQPVGLAAGQPG